MFSNDKITEIFFVVHEFCNEFSEAMTGHVLIKDNGKKSRNRSFKLHDSEVITILILFHAGQFRNLKHFYTQYVQTHLTSEFPKTVSYNRFVELQSKVAMPLVVFLKTCCLGKCTGISIIDSTPIRACHIRREKQNINDKGEILDFMLTQGNVDDREPLKNKSFHKKIFGKLFGDKGYISQILFEQLFIDGIHLITKIRKNMKNSLMQIKDKIILRKRALIETVNDELKNMCQVEHTIHRGFNNFITNLLSGLIAYSFFPKKPSLNIEIIDNKALRKIA